MTCLYYKGELRVGGEVVNSELVGPVVRWYNTVVAIGNHSRIWPQG